MLMLLYPILFFTPTNGADHDEMLCFVAFCLHCFAKVHIQEFSVNKELRALVTFPRYRVNIIFPYSLDPNQALQSSGPDLAPNCLTQLH